MHKKNFTKKVFIISGMLLLIAFAGFAIEGLYFDENGNVGIGATVPIAKLDVYTGDDQRSLIYGGAIELINPTALIDFKNSISDDYDMRIILRGDNGLEITGGNVGIGTNSPTEKLEVNGVIKIGLSYSSPTWDTNTRFWTEAGIGARYDSFTHRFDVGSSRTLAMKIDFNGKVGIGTNSPTAKLDVAGDIQFNSTIKTPGRMHITGGELCYILNKSGVVIGKEWGGNGNLTVQGVTKSSKFETTGGPLNLSGNGWGVNVYMDTDGSSGNDDDRFRIYDNGNLHFEFFGDSGRLYIAGGLTENSDLRYKKDISSIPNALDKITKLQGVNFKWKDRDDNGLQMGVIAQDVEKVFPELVTTHDDGYKSVSYSKLVGALIEAIKEQQKQIDELKGIGTHQEKSLWDKITGIFQ